jgi:hypothetical protein
MRALVAHAVGEPAAVLCLETCTVREPGDGPVRIRVQAGAHQPNDLHILSPGRSHHSSRDRIGAALATNLEPVAGRIVRIPEGSWSNAPKPSIWPRHRPTSQRDILDVIAPARLVRGPVSE